MTVHLWGDRGPVYVYEVLPTDHRSGGGFLWEAAEEGLGRESEVLFWKVWVEREGTDMKGLYLVL